MKDFLRAKIPLFIVFAVLVGIFLAVFYVRSGGALPGEDTPFPMFDVDKICSSITNNVGAGPSYDRRRRNSCAAVFQEDYDVLKPFWAAADMRRRRQCLAQMRENSRADRLELGMVNRGADYPQLLTRNTAMKNGDIGVKLYATDDWGYHPTAWAYLTACLTMEPRSLNPAIPKFQRAGTAADKPAAEAGGIRLPMFDADENCRRYLDIDSEDYKQWDRLNCILAYQESYNMVVPNWAEASDTDRSFCLDKIRSGPMKYYYGTDKVMDTFGVTLGNYDYSLSAYRDPQTGKLSLDADNSGGGHFQTVWAGLSYCLIEVKIKEQGVLKFRP